MALQLDPTLLADHALVREALERHGFQKTHASAFSNGRATVRFEGPMMIAVPGDGSRTWRSNVGSAPPRSEEHASELQSRSELVSRLLLEKKK